MSATWNAECLLAQHKGWHRQPNNTWLKRVGHVTHYNGGELWQREISAPVHEIANSGKK